MQYGASCIVAYATKSALRKARCSVGLALGGTFVWTLYALLLTVSGRLQLDATEFRKNLRCGGAGFTVAPFRSCLFALKLSGEALFRGLLSEHPFGGAFQESYDAIDGGWASLEGVQQRFGCGVGRFGVGGDSVFPGLSRVFGDLRAEIAFRQDVCALGYEIEQFFVHDGLLCRVRLRRVYGPIIGRTSGASLRGGRCSFGASFFRVSARCRTVSYVGAEHAFIEEFQFVSEGCHAVVFLGFC